MNASDTLQFEKWEGLGNDFILVELADDLQPFSSERTKILCDRHRGIGADGILFIVRSASTYRMIVSNADGSRPEMCGNGLRCVAAYLASRMDAQNLELVVATDAGDKSCIIETVNDHYAVTVDMGCARLGMPLDFNLDGSHHSFTTIDIGNPHAITFDTRYTQTDVDHLGPRVATAVAGGTNVEFCQLLERSGRPAIDVVVWERGVGRTLACGTGACAVAAAACEAGKIPWNVPVEVTLPGGSLEITVDPERRVRMRGPARKVFRGEVLA